MEPLSLVVDTNDAYLEDKSVFYIHPHRLGTLRCVQNNCLEKCTIQNSPVADLSGFNFVKILEKLKPNAPVEVYIDQPVTVMQEYDAKQVEANAKLAGFENVEITSGTYTNPEGKECNTLIVTFEKPEKPKSDVEISVSIYKKTTYSKNTAPKKGKK